MVMEYVIGQVLWTKIRFLDGCFPKYKRPYLIVGVGEGYIEILTASSAEDKEDKVAWRTNREIINYNPPFPKRTFVKLDSLQRIRIADIPPNTILLMDGQTLDESELSKIIQLVESQS